MPKELPSNRFWKQVWPIPKGTEVVSDAWLVESLTKCEKVSTDAYQHSRWTHDSTSHWMLEFDKEWGLEYPLWEASAQKRRRTDNGSIAQSGSGSS